MRKTTRFLSGVCAGFVVTCGTAFAAPNFVPEPDSVALVALGIAAVAFFSRRGRK